GIESRSLDLGYKQGSRLPFFSKDEPSPLGTADFFALNYYTSRKVKDLNGVSKKNELSFVGDQGTEGVVDPSWPICGVHWLAIVPDGLRKLLKYIQDTYTSLPIYITENGFSQMGPVQIEVADCSHFYQDTLQEVGKASVRVSED
uniref:Glucosidase, beta, acid 3 (gene/pseudogene) n=1 Tax=Cyprinus carpio carpio TaxID=630221 RepID=A0A9J8D311_CYPCA